MIGSTMGRFPPPFSDLTCVMEGDMDISVADPMQKQVAVDFSSQPREFYDVSTQAQKLHWSH